MRNNNEDSDCIAKFSSVPSSIDICNFGSSHGLYGYNYEDYDKELSCFNFGLSSQTLSYDYRLFEYYQDNIQDGTVVFINVSYFSLFGKNEEAGDGFEAKNKRYYSILPKSLIKEYDLTTALYVKYLPALSTSTGNLIKSLLNKSVDSNDETWKRVASDIDVHADAREAYKRHIVTNKYSETGDRIVNEEELQALYDLIKACEDKGAVPVLITTPFLEEYTATVQTESPDFLENFYSLLEQVVDDTGVEYYDYAFDERFQNSYDLFMNSDHLNKEGARVFVEVLMKEVIQKKGYI